MVNKSPMFSVILPVYNGEQYLRRSISSVLNQTYPDLELIIINDGSSDGSERIAKEFERADDRVKLISRENKGLVYSLNEGISLSKGDWIARMDADDESLPNRLENQFSWAEKQNADVCGGWIKTIGGMVSRTRKYYSSHEANCLQLLFNSCFAHPAVIVKRELLVKNTYNELDQYVEDYGLWCRLVASGAKLTNYPGVVLNYQLHKNQITKVHSLEQAKKRKRVAIGYGKKQFAGMIPEGVHSDIMDRGFLLSSCRNEIIIKRLNMMKNDVRDPEGVITDNAFIYMVRHSEFGFQKAITCYRYFNFTLFQKLTIALLSIVGANQNSMIYKFVYQLG